MKSEFTVKFKTENDAFYANYGSEVSRILHLIAAEVQAGAEHGDIRDVNGNRVGSWKHDLG